MKRYEVYATEQVAIHTGRRRYHVTCLRCGEVVHDATTGPVEMMARHDREECEERRR